MTSPRENDVTFLPNCFAHSLVSIMIEKSKESSRLCHCLKQKQVGV